MEQQGYSITNLWRNLSRKEKLGFGLGILIIIGLIIGLGFMLFGNTNEEVLEPGTTTEESYVNDDGDTVTKTTVVSEDGEATVTETKKDEWGNVTTVDPNLITTYFPYQEERPHDDMEGTLRFYLDVDTENKVISASIEECDIEGDKELVQQYLDSIPVDISEYKVEYNPFYIDAECE